MSNPSHNKSLEAGQDPLARAQKLLRACVHCGFCNATCPTYTLTGDEREGPRGRLYLMKDLLAGNAPDADLAPLDHCVSCKSCETTCPAGVQYTEILDTVREHTQKTRPFKERALDLLTQTALLKPRLLSLVMRMARLLRPALPAPLKRHIPPWEAPLTWPAARHERRVGILIGCLQPALIPALDAKAAVILDRLGISAIAVQTPCCGALPFHLHTHDKARLDARAALSLVEESDIQGLTSTASGCTSFLHDYPRLFQNLPEAARAQDLSTQVHDIARWIDPALLPKERPDRRLTIAWHAPCSLQHGLKAASRVQAILEALGHTLAPIQESALCCGSAGPYSVRHPRFAKALGRRKWRALTGHNPALVVTANVGCLQHLAGLGDRPVRHWLDLVYDAFTNQDKDGRD